MAAAELRKRSPDRQPRMRSTAIAASTGQAASG